MQTAVQGDAQLSPAIVDLGTKGRISFSVSNVESRDAFFCLGVRKSGSTMLHKLVQLLSRRNNINTIDIAGTFFKSGFVVADWMAADLTEVVRPGNMYLGFRSYPSNLERYEFFQRGRKIFMFRDPRDAVVSQYFSDAFSHSLPSDETEAGKRAAAAFLKKRQEAQASDIDAYTLKHARSFENTLMAFAPLFDDPNCLLLRYEEHIFQKKRMINKILQHFGWTCPPGQIESILQGIDSVPESEDGKRFVRKVIPGDHRNKLKPETIRKLNNILKQSMQRYDYY